MTKTETWTIAGADYSVTIKVDTTQVSDAFCVTVDGVDYFAPTVDEAFIKIHEALEV